MRRYIDADKLTFSRVRIIHSDGTVGGWNAVVMSSVINNAPTADVEEVVRCKDCKHRYIPCQCALWYGTGANGKEYFVERGEDFYCSYGERKEE